MGEHKKERGEESKKLRTDKKSRASGIAGEKVKG